MVEGTRLSRATLAVEAPPAELARRHGGVPAVMDTDDVLDALEALDRVAAAIRQTCGGGPGGEASWHRVDRARQIPLSP